MERKKKKSLTLGVYKSMEEKSKQEYNTANAIFGEERTKDSKECWKRKKIKTGINKYFSHSFIELKWKTLWKKEKKMRVRYW